MNIRLLAVLLVASSLGAALCSIGCAKLPVNPSFDVSSEEAKEVIKVLESSPKTLERPVVVLAGYINPGLSSWWVGRKIRKLTGEERVLEVSFFWSFQFDTCRRQVIEAVDAAFPSDDPLWTTEVDVVGLSMGGLVARYAAAPFHDFDHADGESAEDDMTTSRRLKIARLFTLGTPHRGANMAALPSVHPLHRAMRKESGWMKDITRSFRDAEYEVFPYVSLYDSVIGAANAAPFGQTPWWIAHGPMRIDHAAGTLDSRFHADIALRLRGEAPLSTRPPSPIPIEES